MIVSNGLAISCRGFRIAGHFQAGAWCSTSCVHQRQKLTRRSFTPTDGISSTWQAGILGQRLRCQPRMLPVISAFWSAVCKGNAHYGIVATWKSVLNHDCDFQLKRKRQQSHHIVTKESQHSLEADHEQGPSDVERAHPVSQKRCRQPWLKTDANTWFCRLVDRI